MSTYYDVQTVQQNGKPIQNHAKPAQHSTITFQHRLVMILDRLIFKTAVDVSEPDEYVYFYQQYFSGDAVSIKLYDFQPEST